MPLYPGALSPSKAMATDANGAPSVSAATSTELAFVSGVTSNIQTQLANSVLPAGMIAPYAGQTAPAGWLLADGNAVSRVTYSALFTAIGVAHGIGDGSTTFNVPDARGKFIRGFGGATNDPDCSNRTAAVVGTQAITGGATTISSPTITVSSTANLAPGMTVTGTGIPASSVVKVILSATTFTLGNIANSAQVNATATNSALTFTVSNSPTANYVGSVQADQFKSHTHIANPHLHDITSNTAYVNGGATILNSGLTNAQNDSSGAKQSQSTTATNQSTGGNQTHPINVYMNHIIKT
jgi:microcystin-dependent protein